MLATTAVQFQITKKEKRLGDELAKEYGLPSSTTVARMLYKMFLRGRIRPSVVTDNNDLEYLSPTKEKQYKKDLNNALQDFQKKGKKGYAVNNIEDMVRDLDNVR